MLLLIATAFPARAQTLNAPGCTVFGPTQPGIVVCGSNPVYGTGFGLIIPGGGIFGGGSASTPVVAGSLLTVGPDIATLATNLAIK